MTPKKFVLIICLYSFLVLFSASLLGWFFGTIDRSFAELDDIRVRIQSFEEEREAVRRIASLIESYRSTTARIHEFMIRRDDPLEFIETLENVARATGNAAVLDFDSEKSKKGDELVFRVTVDGTREGVFRYVELLELLPYPIRIDEIGYQALNVESVASRGKTAARSSQKSLPEARMIISIFVKAS